MVDTTFSIKAQYKKLQGGPSRQAPWVQPVWNIFSTPKHRFILWLAVQNRLKTKSRLLQFGLSNDDSCPVCMQSTENIQHLFFECVFSNCCMREIMAWLGFNWRRKSLFQTCRWMRSRYTGNRFKRQVGLAACAAVVYKVWLNRNKAIWDQNVNTI
ncbi:uncharacterized protein LOC104884351 [Beta vulgaris subsp. vulgaris]|uniref:uncharacterized protein LOC104884351 n=1 Tax=Beta vulgaris subsp. vulgaris TaxID=3555 RepID=UPI00053F405D|nr:uncharacterized protein LOC104884351 [Beta vulgaris subsp. vulgaris]